MDRHAGACQTADSLEVVSKPRSRGTAAVPQAVPKGCATISKPVRDEAASDTATAVHTTSDIGPDHIWNADGQDGGSHGSTRRPRSHSGASEAPARQAIRTAAPAHAATAPAEIDTGRTATRASSVPVNAMAACDSQAAAAVHSTAQARIRRDTAGSRTGLALECSAFYMER